MSRESQRATKTAREKKLYSLNQKITETPASRYRYLSEDAQDKAWEWVELPKPVFIGYAKHFVPKAEYADDANVQRLAEHWTHGAFSRDKKFLKKNKKTRKLEELFPKPETIVIENPLNITKISPELLPYFECTGREYRAWLHRDVWFYSVETKYFDIKKSKLYHTHVKMLNGQYFRDADDLEEQFENEGGWNVLGHYLGLHMHDRDMRNDLNVYKTIRKDYRDGE